MPRSRTTWAYDATSQLTHEERNGANALDVTHVYDPVGNRTVQIDSGVRTTATYNAGNELLTEITGSARTTYTSDACGNRTKKEEPAATTYYTWNECRNLEVVEPPGGKVTMTYNAAGKRVKKETENESKKFLYDFDRVLEETDDADTVNQTYTSTDQGYGDLLSEYDGTDSLYHQYDGFGSTDALLTEAEMAEDRYVYRAFGKETQTSGSSTSPFTFVGKENYYRDSESDLYLLDKRYYDPEAGRFISEDPLGYDPGDTNLYRYANNQPTENIDPSGTAFFALGNRAKANFIWLGPKNRLTINEAWGRYFKNPRLINLGEYTWGGSKASPGQRTDTLWYLANQGLTNRAIQYWATRNLLTPYIGRKKHQITVFDSKKALQDKKDRPSNYWWRWGIVKEEFDAAKLTPIQKLKIFYADFLSKGAGALLSIGYDTFRTSAWNKVGLQGVFIEMEIRHGKRAVDLIKRSKLTDVLEGAKEFFTNKTVYPPSTFGHGKTVIVPVNVGTAAERLFAFLRKKQSVPDCPSSPWPKYSIGWFSDHPEALVGTDTNLQNAVPKYADIIDRIVREAEWGTHLVVGEYLAAGPGISASGALSIFFALRRLRLTYVGPNTPQVNRAQITLQYQAGLNRRDFGRSVRALQDLAERCRLRKAPNPVARDRSITSQYKNRLIRRAFERYGRSDPARFQRLRDRIREMHADHIHDLQLSGLDEASNLWLIDRDVNLELGRQIWQQIRNLSDGTIIDRIVVVGF